MARERQHQYRQRGGALGQEGITSRARNHYIIADMSDKEIRDSGMPLFEGKKAAIQAASRMNEEEAGVKWRAIELKEGERYLQRSVASDRRWVYSPVYHGIDDGYHGSKRAEVSLEAVTHKD